MLSDAINTSVGETLSIEGRVEVCINNAWGTICKDSYIDRVDAEVMCGQLGGFLLQESVVTSTTSPGVGPIFLDRIDCSEDDNTILDCSLNTFVDQSCDHSRDVGIKCIGK